MPAGGSATSCPLGPRLEALQSLLRSTSPEWPHVGHGNAACKRCTVSPRPAILLGVVTGRPDKRRISVLLGNLLATRTTMRASWVLLTFDDSCYHWKRAIGHFLSQHKVVCEVSWPA